MKWKEKQRLLRFFNDTYFDDKRESEYREDEIFAQLSPSIDRKKLKIYLIEFLDKEWIELDEKRSNAYRITHKGILYYSGGLLSRITNIPIPKKIIIILMIIGIITTWLLYYFR